METPVFGEIDPAGDCDCPGCRHGRRALPPCTATSARPPGRRALVVAATASAAFAAAALPAAAHAPQRPGVPADDAPTAPPAPDAQGGRDTRDAPDTPQGRRAPLYGPGGTPAGPVAGAPLPEVTRAQIIARAQEWVDAKVPYSMSAYWSDGYRQDCSGYVSMAWGLPANEWTGSLGKFADRITKAELQPGDILLFHNEADPEKGSHVVIFGGWTDSVRTRYVAYEQTPPHTRRQTTPYAYWSNSARYLPYRYRGVAAGLTGGAPAAAGTPAPYGVPGYPGRAAFRPGAHGDHVTRLGEQLVRKGYGRFYRSGPGPRWGAADRRAVEAFQRAQGWRGGAADGFPGPETWRRLFA